MPKKDTRAKNMPGHAARTRPGTLRRIRGDTQMKTLENRYNVNFGVRDDMVWQTYKEKMDVQSIKEALKGRNK